MDKNQTTINRIRVNAGKIDLQQDVIAVEEPLQITLEQDQLCEVFSITLRTPGHDQELIFGLLFTEGLIRTVKDIVDFNVEKLPDYFHANLVTAKLSNELKIDLTTKQRRHPSYSSCGLCGKTSLQELALKPIRSQSSISIKIDNSLIKSLKGLLAKQPLFSNTGGSHVAGLIYESDGKLDIEHSPFFEDVGRHNALDKLIGHELRKNDLGQTGLLVLSGRIGFELVQKSVMAGFSVIIALGAPSNLAIQAANQFGIALIGFAKDDSFNLYTLDKQILA